VRPLGDSSSSEVSAGASSRSSAWHHTVVAVANIGSALDSDGANDFATLFPMRSRRKVCSSSRLKTLMLSSSTDLA